ncbi:hypothetical protein [Treponema sp. R6D11]
MYQKGDCVICRSGGVWRVLDADSDSVRLIKHESDNKKAIVINCNEIVRKISTKDVIDDVVSRMSFISTISATSDKERKKLYDKAMAKFDAIEWSRIA